MILLIDSEYWQTHTLGALLLLTVVIGCQERPHRIFDSLQWKTATQSDVSVRAEMVDDLLKKHDFVGYSRSQLMELLGDPLARPAAEAGFQSWDIVYIIGPESDGPLSIDDKALGFRFSDDGVVTAYGLTVN